ncbi:MAG: UvrD-helicase domain-containing protein [Chthonomonas sp.]|nr:UvrD-helicase domain-containing protein [Chthonomonas sp.]
MKLTEEQQLAVECTEPRFTIAASAGSGKTRVLTERYIRHVVDQGLSPHQILTISFTIESAAEMKARITSRLRDLGRIADAQAAEVGPIQTLDSFCRQILQTNALDAGVDIGISLLPGNHSVFRDAAQRVLDSALAEDQLGQKLQELYLDQPDYLQSDLLRLIQFRRERPLPIRELTAQGLAQQYYQLIETEDPAMLPMLMEGKTRGWIPKGGAPGDETLAMQCQLETMAQEAIAICQEEMMRRQEFDFLEIARLAVNLVQENEDARNRLRKQFAAMLVDEAQDLNDYQYELINALQIPQEMLVGDIKQSIYGFRGAAPRLFSDRLASLPVLQLHKNHRTSEPGILQFVRDNLGQALPDESMVGFDLDEVTNYSGVELWAAGNPAKEPKRLAAFVETYLLEKNVPPGDVAILVWQHSDSKPIADALQALGIPAGVIGGRKFHSVPLIRDAANLLELIGNPRHEFRLFAVLRSPIVGLSLDAVLLLQATGDLWNALHEPPADLPPEEQAMIAHFLGWFEDLSTNGDRLSAWEALSSVMERSQLMQAVARMTNRFQNMANLRKLLERAAQYAHLRPTDFAEFIRHAQWDDDREGQAQTVSLQDPVVKVMTVHGAKGLEFPVTILASEKGPPHRNRGLVVHRPSSLACIAPQFPKSWPSSFLQFLKAREEIAENSRTHYVAFTRAKRGLIINIGTTDLDNQTGSPVSLIRELTAHEVIPAGLVIRESPLRLG